MGRDLFPPLSLTSSRGTAPSDTEGMRGIVRAVGAKGGRLLLGDSCDAAHTHVHVYANRMRPVSGRMWRVALSSRESAIVDNA